MPIPTPLRIASVPLDHVYVSHLAATSGPPAVDRLAGFDVPGARPGQWRPSPVLEPTWLRGHAGIFEVVHVHFGFEHRTAPELAAFVATLRALDRPLVLTVHDLDNPHLLDQRAHQAALDVLVPAAAAVITLTPGAAAEIAERWARLAVVLPHPHVVPLDRIAAPRPGHDGFVVGLHAKRRANNDPGAVRRELAEVVAGLPGARLHQGHDLRLTDDELWDHLAGLDVLVLPYRFGTHSGFVEACHDLGTTVIASRVGFLAQQEPVLSFDLGRPGSLTAAVRRAYDERPCGQADPVARAAQREQLATAHAELYAHLATGRAAA